MDEQQDRQRIELAEPQAAQPRGREQGRGPQALRQQQIEVSDEVHFLDYIKVLYKRRWMAITVFLLIVVSTTVYTFTATPLYEARTRLMIDAENPNVVSFKEVIDEQQAKADYYTTQYNILQSRSLARNTLDSLKLWNKPPFGGNTAPAGFSLKRTITGAMDWVQGLFTSKAAVVSEPGADETAAQSKAVDTLLGPLRITPIRNSRLVDVFYTSPDPAMATVIANTLARNYIDQNLEYKFSASTDASKWLENQLTEQKKAVLAAELALQRYREQNDGISPADRGNIVEQRLSQLSTEVTRAKTDKIQLEGMYMELQRRQSDRAALETFPAILNNAYIQQQKGLLAQLLGEQSQLAQTYGDKNEKMIRIKSQIEGTQARIDGEIQKIVQSSRTEYQAAVAREKSLVQAEGDQKAEALRMNSKGIEYSVLAREVESSKQIYDTLMQRAKETGVSGALKTSNIRVIDAAEKPRSPVSPNRQLNLLAALFGGGVFAVGLVFFFEYMDNRLKTPDEIKQHLRLPHLGLLPLLPSSKASGGYALLGSGAPPNFMEAFRVIRTNVVFSTTEEGGQSLLVTSTGPGEGKSLVAANLAISLALAGKRVLLIDADMRKPKAHTVFEIGQEPGLSNLLVGDAKASAAVKASTTANLWILPAGRIPPNPAELLGSQKLKDYLKSFREHFDWMVIDSPPVMAVADASVIAHATSGVVFVVGAEMTSRHSALRAVEQLETSGARFVGAVLNKADLERNAYYYSQYYKREYATYYQT